MTRKCINPKHVGTSTDTGFSTDWCRLCGGVRLPSKPVPVVEVDEPAEDDEQRLGWRQW